MAHSTKSHLTETVVDLQFHQGSFEYVLALTDQGNLHIYHLFTENGHRGTIHVTRGSTKIA